MKQKGQIAFLFFSIAFQTGLAIADEVGGFASARDVIGTWKMVRLENAAKVNKVDPWPLPYQWFRFYEDGTVASMMSTKNATYSAKELDQIFSAIKESSPKYSWKEGFLVIHRADGTPDEHWGVNIFRKDLELPTKIKKGDVIMSLDGGDDKGIVYLRLLRKVEP